MNFLIKLVGRQIARQIEKGSTKGAWIGSLLVGLILGGSMAALWLTGVTGYMGIGLTIAGTLFGTVGGAIAGANIGPEDRLLSGEGQARLHSRTTTESWSLPCHVLVA